MPKEFTATTETLVLRAVAITLVCGAATLAGSRLMRGPATASAQRGPAPLVTQAVAIAPRSAEVYAPPEAEGATSALPIRSAPLLVGRALERDPPTGPAWTQVAAVPEVEAQSGVKTLSESPQQPGVYQAAQPATTPLASSLAEPRDVSPTSSEPARVPTLQYPSPVRVAQLAAASAPSAATSDSPQPQLPIDKLAPHAGRRTSTQQHLLKPLQEALLDRSDQLQGSPGRGAPASSYAPRLEVAARAAQPSRAAQTASANATFTPHLQPPRPAPTQPRRLLFAAP